MSRCPPERVEEPGSRSAERPPREGSATVNLSQITLRPLGLDEALALLAGAGGPAPGLRWHPEYPLAETLGALSLLVAAHGGGAAPDPFAVPRPAPVGEPPPAWWLHQVVLDGLVVGDVSFHGPPPVSGPAEVEIGFAVVAGLRRRGIATGACRLVLARAWRAGAVRVLAETEPENVASQRVLAACGFTELGYRRYVIERPGR